MSNWGDSDPDAESAQTNLFFREEFEIDLDDEKYAKVAVPDFKNGRLGRFIHEFDSVCKKNQQRHFNCNNYNNSILFI